MNIANTVYFSGFFLFLNCFEWTLTLQRDFYSSSWLRHNNRRPQQAVDYIAITYYISSSNTNASSEYVRNPLHWVWVNFPICYNLNAVKLQTKDITSWIEIVSWNGLSDVFIIILHLFCTVQHLSFFSVNRKMY